MMTGDVRSRGFDERSALSVAWAWLDALPGLAGSEVVGLADACGRVLSDAIINPADLPGADRAAADGYAVHAADCDGASAYSPVMLARQALGAPLASGSASPVAAGQTLPGGANAVLAFEALSATGTRWLEVLAPAAPGDGIERRGDGLRAGVAVVPRGRILRPQDVACLAAIGLSRVAVRPRPRVRLMVPGAKSGLDAVTPMLRGLLARDGALAEPHGDAPVSEGEIVLIAGRSGAGFDDASAAAIRDGGGTLALHGLAMRPGGSAGLGLWRSGAPVLLLPGEPFACLAAYDMLAGRLVRRLTGIGPKPYAVVPHELTRKIVSGIGVTDIVPVGVADGRAQPINAWSGVSALAADGFVVVLEASEGHPAGAVVSVHLYGTAPGLEDDMRVGR